MIKNGYTEPKWSLVNHIWPTKWVNNSPSILEESWIIDMRER